MGYAFTAPRPEYLGPFVRYSSVEDNLNDSAALQRVGDRIDRQHPSLVLTETAVLGLPLEPVPLEPVPLEPVPLEPVPANAAPSRPPTGA